MNKIAFLEGYLYKQAASKPVLTGVNALFGSVDAARGATGKIIRKSGKNPGFYAADSKRMQEFLEQLRQLAGYNPTRHAGLDVAWKKGTPVTYQSLNDYADWLTKNIQRHGKTADEAIAAFKAANPVTEEVAKGGGWMIPTAIGVGSGAGGYALGSMTS